MTLNCNGKILDLLSPKVMGIVNVTEDSFYDGGRLQNEKDILTKVEKLISEGASIIDVGVMSTRPGAITLSVEEELSKAVDVIKILRKHFPEIILSIDTQRGSIAKATYEEGVDMINDISGGDFDDQMFLNLAEIKIPYVLTHTQGTPQIMQKNPTYEDVGLDIIKILNNKLFKLKSMGVEDVLIDPGFGFGKTVSQNYKLLNDLGSFAIMEKPILIGVSRKSMIWKALKTDPENALNGTTVLHTFALLKGANILRVHDVREAKEVIKLVDMLNDNKI